MKNKCLKWRDQLLEAALTPQHAQNRRALGTPPLAETAGRELRDHLSQCPACADELKTLRDVRVAAVDRAKATQTAVANALNAAAERIEKTTQVLNRTIGGGVAIG